MNYEKNRKIVSLMSDKYFLRVKAAVQDMVVNNADLLKADFYAKKNMVEKQHLIALRELLLSKPNEARASTINDLCLIYNCSGLSPSFVKTITPKYFRTISKNKIMTGNYIGYALFCLNEADKNKDSRTNFEYKKVSNEKKYSQKKSLKKTVKNYTPKESYGDKIGTKVFLSFFILVLLPMIIGPIYIKGIFLYSLINLFIIFINELTNFYNKSRIIYISSVLFLLIYFKFSVFINLISCLFLILIVVGKLKDFLIK